MMHYKNVAAVVCRIMDHWFILHFIFFSLPTAIFTFYTTFLSQILVYHSFNFTVIFNLILLSICPCSCPHGLSPCIFLALIHISTGKYQNGPSHCSLDKTFYIRPPHRLLPGLWNICPWASCLSSLRRWCGITLYGKQKNYIKRFLVKDWGLGELGEINSSSHITHNAFVVHNGDWTIMTETYFISGEDVIHLIRRQRMPWEDQ